MEPKISFSKPAVVECFPKNYEVVDSVEESLFSNDLLLRNILKYSNFRDLKSFRQINRLWNMEATKILRKNFGMKPLTLHSSSFYIRKPFKKNKIRPRISLQDFSNLIGQSRIFPCTNLMLEGPIEIVISNENEIYNFFSAYGSHFKSLELSIHTVTPENVLALQDILVKRLPNLEILNILCDPKLLFENSSFAENESQDQNKKTEMKKLETLIISQLSLPKEFLKRILKLAPNLKNIYWENYNGGSDLCGGYRILEELNALHLLKIIDFYFEDNAKCMKVYEMMLEKNCSFSTIGRIQFSPRLSPSLFPRIVKILTKTFESIQNSLRNICHLQPLGHIPELKIPVLPYVKEILLDCKTKIFETSTSYNPITFFPANFKFSETFPNLRKVKLLLEDGYDRVYEIQNIFGEFPSPLLSVRELDVRRNFGCSFPTEWVKFICELFPRVTKASFSTVFDLSSDVEHIFRLNCLEKLEMSVVVDFKRDKFPAMDSAFTGLSEEDVQNLKENLKQENVYSGCKPSIVDLKDLRKLKIDFVDRNLFLGNDDGDYGNDDGDEYLYDDDNYYNFSNEDSRATEEKNAHVEDTIDVVQNEEFHGAPTEQVIVDFGSSGKTLRVGKNIIVSDVTEKYGFRLCPLLKTIEFRYTDMNCETFP